MTINDSIRASLTDWKVSILLFFQNLKTLIVINLVFYILSLIISLIFFYIGFGFFGPHDPSTLDFSNLIRLLELIITNFMWCQYGFAHDIMTTGDYCTEGKRIFFYYKKYWFSYLLLSILINTPKIIWEIIRIHEMADLFLIRFLIDFVFFIMFIEIFPIITSGHSLRTSFKENFKILLKNPLRIMLTWLIFFIIFENPWLQMPNLHPPLRNLIPFSFEFNYLIFRASIIFSLAFLGFSLMAFISTRIYNSISFHAITKIEQLSSLKM
jgi:hypothetical protein